MAVVVECTEWPFIEPWWQKKSTHETYHPGGICWGYNAGTLTSWWCNFNLIDQIHKSHNTPVPYPTIQHSEQKYAHFCSECCIVGFRTDALWDLWEWSLAHGFALVYNLAPCHMVQTLQHIWSTIYGCPVFKSIAETMMTSSNGNFFRVTGHLCGAFTCHRWIPRTKASDAELWCFLWSL